ncbi:hypothetical protein EVAR_62724_1, partial [Eumeta japonica]
MSKTIAQCRRLNGDHEAQRLWNPSPSVDLA